MAGPLFTMENGVVFPRVDVSASVPRDDDVLAWMYRMRRENPGLYVLAATHCWRAKPLRRDMRGFVLSGIKDQLRFLGLPARPAIGRVLAKVRFTELDYADPMDRLHRWLSVKNELPKVVLHAHQLHMSYLEVLMRNEWLGCLPYPTEIGLHPESDQGIDQFLTMFELVCRWMGELGMNEADCAAAFSRVRSYDDLCRLYERLDDKARRQRLIDEDVQVPLPLEEIEGIEAPRTIEDFECLSDLQANCVHSYFQRALNGHCAIYTVVSNRKVMLTAEIVPSKDGFWLPSEVLARENTLPRQKDVEHLYHWLALIQGDPNDSDGYARNLVRLLRCVCYWTLKNEDEQGLSPFLLLEVNAASNLVSERVAKGHAEQLGMLFDKKTRVIRSEKD